MVNEKEREEMVLTALKTIGEVFFEGVIFRLENSDEKLKELPLRAHILGERATLHKRAESLICKVKEIYPENGLEIIKEEIIKTIKSAEAMARDI